MTEHLANRRAHEQLESNERAGGIAREPKEGRAVEHAERDGLAGAHGDAVEQDLALALHEGRHVVVIARRSAARGHHDIAFTGGAANELANSVLIVGRDAVQRRLGARVARGRHEGRRVHVANLAARGHDGAVHELCAQRDDAHARRPMHRHRVRPGVREQAGAGGRNDLARPHDHIAATRLEPRLANILAHACGLAKRHVGALIPIPVEHLDDLVLDHGVDALRHGGAGHDAHRLALPNRALEHMARGLVPNDLEDHGMPIVGLRKIAGVHRVPVHGAIGKRGEVDVGRHVPRQRAPDRAPGHDLLDGRLGHMAHDDIERLLDQDHVRVGIVVLSHGASPLDVVAVVALDSRRSPRGRRRGRCTRPHGSVRAKGQSAEYILMRE